MFKVDTTTGTLVSGSYSVTLPGLLTFDNVFLSGPIFADWRIAASNSSGNQVVLIFTTAPTPGSLKGFTGGSIVGGANDLSGNYVIGGGSITPCPKHHRWFSLLAACWCSA